jgi:hypothetical protein
MVSVGIDAASPPVAQQRIKRNTWNASGPSAAKATIRIIKKYSAPVPKITANKMIVMTCFKGMSPYSL